MTTEAKVVDENPSPHWCASSEKQWIKKGAKGELNISAKALNITWGGDSRFWRWIDLHEEGREFKVAAELLQVNWLQVTGNVDVADLPSNKKCEILYVFKFNVDAFGWHSVPITFKITTPDGEQIKRSEILESYRKNSDKWQEIKGGEFSVDPSNIGSLEFGMYEVDSNWWKGSMVLERVIIRPIN